MKKIRMFYFLPLALGGLLPLLSSVIDAKKAKKKTSSATASQNTVHGDSAVAPVFKLRSLEVVQPDFFSNHVALQGAESEGQTQVNPTYRELPHHKDNEFEAKRKKDSVREKWLGRQFLIVMTPNEYKNSREIIKNLEPEVYTNAELLEAYDFKKKIFPLKVWLNCIDIGTDRQESGKYESFGETKFAYTYVTHQICLNSLLTVDFSLEKNRYPDYLISIPEKEAEVLKENFEKTQIGIVVAWLPDDTGEVKAERVDWGQFEYNGQLASETFDRLELKWTALEILIRYKDKIYQSKLAPKRKPRFALSGHDAAQTRQKFREATQSAKPTQD